MQFKKIFIVTTLLFFCSLLSAQNYPFVQYTPKDGLVNSRVRKVFQDSRGRIYFLTYEGLSVYDGARFMNYTVQNGLATNMVNDVLELGDDSLLISTNTSQLNILVHGKIKLFTSPGKIFPVINQFLKSADGNIYATADEGLYVLKQQHMELLPFSMYHPEMRNPYLGAIIESGDFLIVGTNDLRDYQGLYLYDKKNRKLTDAKPDKIISSLSKDKKNNIWITNDNGVYNLDSSYLQRGKLKLSAADTPYKKLSGYKGSLLSFDDHNVWLVNKGKEIIKAGDNGSLTVINFAEQQWTLSNNPVFIDRENITWVCTEGSGVIKLISTRFRTDQPAFGASTSIIHSSLYISDATWYFVNSNSLVRVTTHGYEKFVGNISPNFFLIGQFNGHLIAGDGKSIYSAKIPVSKFGKIYFEREFTMPLDLSLGARCFIDPNGNIILCNNQLLVIHQNKIINKQPIPPGDLIEGIATDANKQLWVLTRYAGIRIFTEHADDTDNYLHEILSFKNEFNNICPRSMLLDEKRHIIWIGTRYQGVISFMLIGNRLKKIKQFQTGQGLTDNFVTALACDSSGNLIVGTQAGLDRIIISTSNEYTVENITKNNNIFGFIANIWVNSLNETYALTNTGTLLQLLPVDATSKKYEPKLFIEGITVNGEQVPQTDSDLHFAYHSQNITFNVAAPTYVDEKQVLYSYRLTGNNNSAWSLPSSNASIYLLNLSPGVYNLHVKAFFRSTSYSSKELSFHFIISPPWWQSWWFLMLEILMAVTLLTITIRIYYTRKMKKKFAVLEKQRAIEKERTRIASDMHDDLGAGLSTIRFLSEKVKRNSFSEITKIDAEKIVVNSNELVQKMNEIIWAMNEKNDTLEDLLFYSRSYAVEYCEENNLNPTTYLPETVPHIFVSGEIRRNIFLTIKESLHNIVKHANAKKVTLDFRIDKNLLINITDDGMGLRIASDSGGNGLKNMQKRIESINGTFELINKNGVSVIIKIPLQI